MVEKLVGIADGLLEETLGAAYAPVVTLSELIKNSSDACVNHQDSIRIDIDTDNNTITIKDNGSGFSSKVFDGLSSIGVSQKMTADNQTSKIGEPYAGSKGLGILTAFNLCNRLELITYSLEDMCAYQMSWDKGSQKFIYTTTEAEITGTQLRLIGVSAENMKLVTLDDELGKLYASSINYYIDSEALPIIEVYENGVQKHRPQKIKIEELYQKHKHFKGEKKGFFIAKGIFNYSNNTLTLSYEDNYKNIFNFSNEILELTNIESLRNFLFKHNIDFKSVVYRNIAELCKNYDAQTFLDNFSGIYYIWREKKEEDINYPCGARIYVNNYGLYDYLNTENDWLLHSEISQNISASNYKLKNTYGYVKFDHFNEHVSGLKISKDRNNFNENLAKKKFLYVMQGFVSGIFSSIDITLKDKKYKRYIFELRYDTRKLSFGDEFNIKEILYTTLPMQDITIEHDEFVKINGDNGTVTINKLGSHIIKFSDGIEWLEAVINVEDSTPTFELTQTKIKKLQGETIELKNLINKSSLINIQLDEIYISSDSAVLKNSSFSAQNYPGEYTIKFKYNIANDGEVCRILQVTIEPLYARDANHFNRLFPFYKALTDYIKIKEIIDEMSKCYKQYPNISIIALRSLLEVATRAFLAGVCEDEKGSRKTIAVDQAIGWSLDEVYAKNNHINVTVLNKYRDRLITGRKRLINDYNKLELNSYVHDSDALPTSNEVFQATKRFSMFLNFIIESLVAKQGLHLP